MCESVEGDDIAMKTEEAFEKEDVGSAVTCLFGKYMINLRDFPDEFNTTYDPHYENGNNTIIFDNIVIMRDGEDCTNW